MTTRTPAEHRAAVAAIEAGQPPRAANDNEPNSQLPDGAPVLAANDNAPTAASDDNRVPIFEEFKAGRISRAEMDAILWFLECHTQPDPPLLVSAKWTGAPNDGAFLNRDREKLWGQEDTVYRWRIWNRIVRALRPRLFEVLWQAIFCGSEMRDLAPAHIEFPKEKMAAAGRLQLKTAAAIVGRVRDETESAHDCDNVPFTAHERNALCVVLEDRLEEMRLKRRRVEHRRAA